MAVSRGAAPGQSIVHPAPSQPWKYARKTRALKRTRAATSAASTMLGKQPSSRAAGRVRRRPIDGVLTPARGASAWLRFPRWSVAIYGRSIEKSLFSRPLRGSLAMGISCLCSYPQLV